MHASSRFLQAAAVWTTTAALAVSLTACSGQSGEGNPAKTTDAPSAAATGNATTPATADSTGEPSATLDASAATSGSDSNGTLLPAPNQSQPAKSTASASPTSSASASKPDSSSAGSQAKTSGANPRFDTVDNPSSLSVVVNKQRPLQPRDYKPSGLEVPAISRAAAGESALLRSEAAAAAERMFKAASADGINLTMLSGYRSYQTQAATYNSWVARLGSVAEADTVSARPGYSEHQTGLALDIGVASGACSLKYCFNNLPAASWAEKNAYKYGYIVRYQLRYHQVTGFHAEPWHLRFIGVQDAKSMHQRGIHTLEKFFGLPAAPSY